MWKLREEDPDRMVIPKSLSKTAQISDLRTKTLWGRAAVIGAASDDIAAQDASPGSLYLAIVGDDGFRNFPRAGGRVLAAESLLKF